ncbi:hypothetical protein CO046_03485 [Candidatus Peregrinibacteria bacterium CG_4_9_14_0_2_um_filter_53_11]|nr:MAG: hypothetical protein CO046_03485 [Candidatus Peregrinibacteria bacterium CG_4_9_14_0_2_um_filter_53_11]
MSYLVTLLILVLFLLALSYGIARHRWQLVEAARAHLDRSLWLRRGLIPLLVELTSRDQLTSNAEADSARKALILARAELQENPFSLPEVLKKEESTASLAHRLLEVAARSAELAGDARFLALRKEISEHDSAVSSALKALREAYRQLSPATTNPLLNMWRFAFVEAKNADLEKLGFDHRT